MLKWLGWGLVGLNALGGVRMSEEIGKNEFTPFGNPDGSRADIEEISGRFVTFGGGIWGGLATRNNDLTARVIVGRKGSGKTVYLRRLQAFASGQDDLYADNIQQDLPTTAEIIKFCQFFSENILTEKWMLLWRRAILRSIISHLMHNPRLKEKVSQKKLERLIETNGSLIREFNAPISVYSQVNEIIYDHEYKTGHKITGFLEDPRWHEIESIVADMIGDCPPICFYIDAVDEEFAHAPIYWHRCQKGLFYTTMRLLRDSRLGGRLHIFICIRDIVYSAVLRSEHATRYIKEPHIRILNWNKESIRYFLQAKLNMLDNELFVGNVTDGKNVTSWLGIRNIHNDIRDIDEPIEQYLLRHTRLLPRDIIVLGNSLCEEIIKFKTFEKEHTIEDIIRDTVSKMANTFGNEQLKICSNQIASNQTPKDAALHEYSEFYTANEEYTSGITEDLKKLIRHIGKDLFSRSELKDAREQAHKLFGEDVHPFSVLWQNGLIGYLESGASAKKDKINFYSEASMHDFRIPFEKDNYVFHSCLIDSAGIEAIGKQPWGY